MSEGNIAYKGEKCAVASFTANYIAGILHPFDVIKTRFQSIILMDLGHDGKLPNQNIVPKYNGIFHAFQEIYRQ